MGKMMSQIGKDERGAASVLVIVMVIVLVALGNAALTSTNANRQLSSIALDWNKMYYELDNEAESYIMDVDIRLGQAENRAVRYILDADYEREALPDIPDSIQQKLSALCNQDASNKTAVFRQAMQIVYLYKANKNLQELQSEYPLQEIMTIDEGNTAGDSIQGASVSMTFYDETDMNRGLRVSLVILPIPYTLTQTDQIVTGLREPNTSRYVINEWKQFHDEVKVY